MRKRGRRKGEYCYDNCETSTCLYQICVQCVRRGPEQGKPANLIREP